MTFTTESRIKFLFPNRFYGYFNFMKKVFLLILYFSMIISLRAGGIRFFRETITITVADSFCTVEGIYYFKNTSRSARTIPVLYPFKIESNLPYPDSVNIVNLNDSAVVAFNRTSEACSFSLSLPARSVTRFKVFYRQATPARHMTYILTTTRHWKSALLRADYYIIVPRRLKLSRLPFKKMKKMLSRGNTIYYIQIKNFLPVKNLNISWGE